MAKSLKSVAAILVALFFCAVLVWIGGLHHQALRWGLQYYLGKVLQGRVSIGQLQGGYFSGLEIRQLSYTHPSSPLACVVIEQIHSDFQLLGEKPPNRHCALVRPKIFLEECALALGAFSLPFQRPILFFPRSIALSTANISIDHAVVLQSGNRPDNVLLGDLIGSVIPKTDQTIEFVLKTSQESADPNRLQIIGTIQSTRESSNVDFDLFLSKLETLNLFLRSVHVLDGNAQLSGKVRSGRLESAQLELKDVDLLIPADRRVLKMVHGKIAANDQYVSLRDLRIENEGSRLTLSGDAQSLRFTSGRIDIDHLLAKGQWFAKDLSSKPIDLEFTTSTTVFYKNPHTLSKLQWDRDILESLSLFEGKLNLNNSVDLEIRGKYSPGVTFHLDYKIVGLDFEKLKREWFGQGLGSLLQEAKIGGEGQAQCEWDKIDLTGSLQYNDSPMPYHLVWTQRQLQLVDWRLDEATNVQGRLDLDQHKDNHLVFHFQDESILRFFNTLGSGRKPSLSGKCTGQLELKGNLLDPAISGHLDLRNGTIKGIPYRDGQIVLAGKYPKVHLDRSVIFIKKDMPVAVTGYIDLSQKDVFENVKTQRGPSDA